MLKCYISCYVLPHTTTSINTGLTNLTGRSPVVPSSFPCAGFLSRARWWPDLGGLLSCERITLCVWYSTLTCFSKHIWHLLESTWLDFTILMATLKKVTLKWMSTTSAVPGDSVVFGLFMTLTAVIWPWMASLLCSLYCKVSNSLFKSAAAISGVWAEDEHKGLKRKISTRTVKANHCAVEGRLNSAEQQVPINYYLTGGLKKIFWIFDTCVYWWLLCKWATLYIFQSIQ